MIFLKQILCTWFFKDYCTDLYIFFLQNIRRDQFLFCSHKLWHRHFRYHFIVDFLNFTTTIVQRSSQKLYDINVKFSGLIDNRKKLNKFMFYSSKAESVEACVGATMEKETVDFFVTFFQKCMSWLRGNFQIFLRAKFKEKKNLIRQFCYQYFRPRDIKNFMYLLLHHFSLKVSIKDRIFNILGM